MGLMWHCKEHGVRKPRWARTGRRNKGQRAYCDLCALGACRDYRKFKGGDVNARERARRWYEANRDRKIAYETAKRAALTPEAKRALDVKRARQKREQRADARARLLVKTRANLDYREPAKNSSCLAITS